jgi:uncharacterized protein (UPF0332 family)
MKPEDTETLISYRMQRAEESLRAAVIMYEKDILSFSMNRIYYSMFYAAQAALTLKGVSFSKHAQVKSYLNRELVKTGIIPISLGRIYNKAFEYRQKFDYVDFAEPNKDLVESYLKEARVFLDGIEQYLQNTIQK